MGDHAPIVGALTGAFREDISRRFIGLSRDSLYAMPWLVMTSLRLCVLGVTAVSHDALGPDTWDLSMVFAPDAPRVVWLFTRGRESVRIEVTAGEGGGGRVAVRSVLPYIDLNRIHGYPVGSLQPRVLYGIPRRHSPR